jgi:endonuclease YncB( thermonuclease family)
LPLALLIVVAAIIYGVTEFQTRPAGARFGDEINISSAQSHVRFSPCSGPWRVNCVVDGDTIWHDGAKIRIADIDAPEIHDPKCPAEFALGERAKERLLSLLNEGPFYIVHSGGRDRDKYGRDLRVIERNGVSISETMIAERLVRRWDGSRHPWCS